MWVHNGGPGLDNESQYVKIMAVSIVLTVIMSVIVTLRFYVRAIMLRAIGPDDWVILFGAACSIAYNGLCIGQTKWGLGLKVIDRPQMNLDQFSVVRLLPIHPPLKFEIPLTRGVLQLNYSGKPIYIAGILAFKVSLCLSYLRIVTSSTRTYRRVVYLVLITCIAGHIAGILVLIFLCSPVEKSWKPLIPGHCIPNANSVYGLGAISIFYDIVILLLPIPMLVSLQINMRKRVGLVGIFCLGIFTTFCSIMRLAQIKSILATGDQTGLVLWATIEMNVGISLTCLPTLMPIIKYYREKHSSGGGGAYDLGDSSGNRLGYLKSGTRTNITTKDNSPGWKDRDSIDNSSQKQILGLDSALHDSSSNENLEAARPGKSRGITTTTEVRVEVTNATEEAELQQPNKKGNSKW
ncbi:integral membrane protein [Xylogone sp. PMI_703]|nr:integral membrane protein [Xylogone sp. PMI_703]